MFNYDRFEALRAEKGITKKFIADALGKKDVIFHAWKTNKSRPSAEQLRIVADILDTTPAYLMGETDIKEKAPAQKGEGLTDEQNELVRLFQNADPAYRAAALALLREAEAAHKSQDV